MKHKQHIKNKATAALLAGILALGLLAGCAQHASEPVVTEDDLTPSSTVQEVIARVADNGKTYAYLWPAGDPAALEETLRQSYAEKIKYMEENGSAEDEIRGYEEQAEQLIQQALAEAGEERELEPVISPQEAANLAGQTMEELYGMDLAQGTLYLRCYIQTLEGDIRHTMGPEPGRMYWDILFDVGEEGSWATGLLDATTGEWKQLDYIAGGEEQQAWEATRRSDCVVPEPNSPHFGSVGWNIEHAEFAAIAEAIKQRAVGAVSGSVLVGGAQVTKAELRTGESEELPYWAPTITLILSCDNGKTYGLHQYSGELFYPEYNSGYPLRAYDFYQCIEIK